MVAKGFVGKRQTLTAASYLLRYHYYWRFRLSAEIDKWNMDDIGRNLSCLIN